MSKLIDFTNPKWGNSYIGYGLCISKFNFENDDYFSLIQNNEICIFKALKVEKENNPKDMYRIIDYISIGSTDDKEDLNINTILEFEKEYQCLK